MVGRAWLCEWLVLTAATAECSLGSWGWFKGCTGPHSHGNNAVKAQKNGITLVFGPGSIQPLLPLGA